ncbi:T9SS type A sorting domain-containing protein [Edaphocola flava]|uniref:T9SS type A sorting domain-containing protein n=1 Tax=Edaphocola flava TaxID=2499629 RepID=UPI00100A2444|nr:T9SS type A sorting domain-containing protein [Edaphocola flava]
MAVSYLLKTLRCYYSHVFARNEDKSYRKKMRSLIAFTVLCAVFCTGSVHSQAQGPVLEWARSMGGTDFDNGYAVSVTNDGNVFTTGLFRGTVDFDPGPATYNITAAGAAGNTLFVSRLNSLGEFVWAKSFGNAKFNYAYAIANDRAENVYVAGYFSDTVDFDPGPGVFNLISTGTASASDIFVLKLDKAGGFIWARRIGSTGIVDRAFNLKIDNSDNVLVSGSFIGTVDFDPGVGVYNLTPLNAAANGFVLKLSPGGDFIWAKDLGQMSRTNSTATAYALAVDSANNVFTAGYFRDTVDFDPGPGQAKLGAKGTTVNDDIFVLKLDSAGNYAWAKSFGSKKLDQGSSIAVDPMNNVYFTAAFNDTIDFDPGPGTTELMAASATDQSVAIVKLDNNGNLIWAKNVSGYGACTLDKNFSFSIKSDHLGNTYTTGYFCGSADFSPGTPGASITSSGSTDIFMMKLKPTGDFVWVRQMGGLDIDVARSSVLDNSGNVYTTGWFRGTSDFDPAVAGSSLLTSTNNSFDIVVMKFSCGDSTSSTITDTTDCLGYTLNGTTYTSSGVYTTTVLNSLGCDSMITLDLTVIPVGDITVVVNNNKLETVESFTTYKWMRNGQLISGATDSTYAYTQNGDYRVIVTNANGCTDTSDIYVVNTVSIDEAASMLANQIRVFPNPTSDMVNVQSPVNVDVTIIDIKGRTVNQVKNASRFSMKELPVGLYLLRITDKYGQLIKTTKVTKQ